MKMATKLTKAFAAFVGERGFEIVNEDEISQRPGEDYKLARQIVCTIHDNIPANIFEPQILMTIGGIQNRLKRLLKSETYVSIIT